jgi:hypothetical protein
MAARGNIPHEFSNKNGLKTSHSVRETRTSNNNPSLRNHPQAESIRKYSRALGLTAQEQIALCENPALLMHTIAMEKSMPHDDNVIEKFIKKRREKKSTTGAQEEQCIIS